MTSAGIAGLPGAAIGKDAVSAGDACLLVGRDEACDWDSASRREWLVTNGLGGFAAGTVSGANTRRYHGLLVAALKPPVERFLLVSKIEVSVTYLGRLYELSANEFAGGVVAPQGFVHIESFRIEAGLPVWRYALADAILEQSIAMQPECNISTLRLRVLRASAPLQLSLIPLTIHRDYHAQNRGARPVSISADQRSCAVAFDGARPIRLSVNQGEFIAEPDWYWNFWHRVESERGLDACEDLFKPGRFLAALEPHGELTLVASADPEAESGADPGAPRVSAAEAAGQEPAADVVPVLPDSAPAWIRQLARAADQFIVRRGDAPAGRTLIAGYPWFADWGRDTMIALPGLTSALGRHAVAAEVLTTFARFVDRGMLPNRFPDAGEAPQYNSVDATLWFFQAIREAMEYARDESVGMHLYPTLIEIIRAHAEGTRYGIKVDPRDALLRAGEPGVQLTWMDAKIGGWVVTPRIGKPVEVNALWLNALEVAATLASRCGDEAGLRLCTDLKNRGSASFAKFWNAEGQCLFDVIDVAGGPHTDASIRPNQLFAVSLPYRTLTQTQMQAVVTVCARELLTSHGLRSLSRGHPDYQARYSGNPAQRDGAYHQGTVWSWLLGPFAMAHFNAFGDAAVALEFLEPMRLHLRDACVGSVSEIFDGDAPHVARGCFAQAWGVGETLHSWLYLDGRRA